VLRITVIAAQDDPITLSDLPEFGEDRVDFRATRDEFDRLYLLELLKANNFEIERTSRATRMESKALLAKIQKLGIDIQIGS
jgi:DNA-binding NtrC family response regulator